MELERRRLLRHGFAVMLLALLLGFPTALAPHARAWMAAHVTAFLASLLVLAVAHVWADLRLGPRQRRAASALLLTGVYSNLAANVFGAIVDLPGPATRPGVSYPHWQFLVFAALSAVLVPTLIGAVGLVVHGLRGDGAS